MKHEHDSGTNYNYCAWDGPQRLGKGAWKSEDELKPSNYSIVEIGQNTEKSHGDLPP